MENIEKSVWELAEHLIGEVRGSGIDADWTKPHKKNYAVIKNSFHCMNEYGSYEGWQDFSLLLPLNGDVSNFKLVFHSPAYLARKNQLRDFLEDLFAGEIDLWLTSYKDSYLIKTVYGSDSISFSSRCLNPIAEIAYILERQSPRTKAEYRVRSFEIIYPGS